MSEFIRKLLRIINLIKETYDKIKNKKSKKNILHYFYFSVITVTTVGYGDINPVTPLAKNLVTIQSAMGYLLFTIMLGLMIAWVDRMKKN
ncbi:two pore domain potassium channel family protein [candidate division KSB1 bacterium]|nr:two pore domain potassium channel family protein [candidate division KSB1 bacterium]